MFEKRYSDGWNIAGRNPIIQKSELFWVTN